MEYCASKNALILRLNTSSFMERGADASTLGFLFYKPICEALVSHLREALVSHLRANPMCLSCMQTYMYVPIRRGHQLPLGLPHREGGALPCGSPPPPHPTPAPPLQSLHCHTSISTTHTGHIMHAASTQTNRCSTHR